MEPTESFFFWSEPMAFVRLILYRSPVPVSLGLSLSLRRRTRPLPLFKRNVACAAGALDSLDAGAVACHNSLNSWRGMGLAMMSIGHWLGLFSQTLERESIKKRHYFGPADNMA